ncbi:hypothetical protein [Nesterenkonia sp. NBAIMH1]|uniref:hypothetical protein n=1 Tax=Nesterenkonia sp. NBAIMH1 TaxID=2600320 RepID=UPI0011B4DC1A|nr:hypothetical protein [Nesterenkonia sp. NBAIMH1]
MKATKTSITSLNDLPRKSWEAHALVRTNERVLYPHTHDGERYDFILSPRREAHRLIVFFSGDARRDKFQPPVFQRWSWADKFPAHCLYMSDPALYRSETLGLTWYAGAAEQDYLKHIWGIVDRIADQLGVVE